MNVCIEYRSKKGVGGYVNGHFATLVMDGKYIDSSARPRTPVLMPMPLLLKFKASGPRPMRFRK
jgi:hypothetical protein